MEVDAMWQAVAWTIRSTVLNAGINMITDHKGKNFNNQQRRPHLEIIHVCTLTSYRE